VQVFVFWEDYDLWYRGKIKKIDFDTMQAVIFYPDTEEEEPDADLGALSAAKQLAFKESRPLDHQLGLNEVEHSKEFAAAEKRKRGRPPKGQERPRDPAAADDGVYYDDFEDDDEPAPEDSDPSYEGRGRKRGKGEGADSKRAAQKKKHGEEDEEAVGQRLLARAQGGVAADPSVRDKVRGAFTNVLEQAKVEAHMNPMGGMPFGFNPALAAQMMPFMQAHQMNQMNQMNQMAGAGMLAPQPGMHHMNPMGMPMGMPMGVMPPAPAPPAMVAPPAAPAPAVAPPPQAAPAMPAPVAAPAPVEAPAPVVEAPPAPPASEPAAESAAAPDAAPAAPPAEPAEPAADLPKPAVVANVVEDELVRMYGE
jgi:hypothetical protein